MTTAQKRIKKKKKKMKLKNERKIRITTLDEAGYSVTDISKTVGVSESYVRKILKEKDS